MSTAYPECVNGTGAGDKDIKGIIDSLKGDIEKKIGKQFTVVSHRPQKIPGTHYLVKVKTGQGNTDFSHLLLFQPGDKRKAELINAETGKTALAGKDD